MFHSLTVHQGRDNTTTDRIRLAASARYQPVDRLALGPQERWADWEELYADRQPDDPLKFIGGNHLGIGLMGRHFLGPFGSHFAWHKHSACVVRSKRPASSAALRP